MRFEAEKRETYLQGVDQLHRCWTSLKGGVARSNHTRRDTIEINVPWCTCNLMSLCQVSHIYAFSCLLPWLLDAWHSMSRLKGCCLECIKSPTWMIPRLLASVKVTSNFFVRFCWVFSCHTCYNMNIYNKYIFTGLSQDKLTIHPYQITTRLDRRLPSRVQISHPKSRPKWKVKDQSLWRRNVVQNQPGAGNLEDHRRTCRWLKTMISCCPQDLGLFPFQMAIHGL